MYKPVVFLPLPDGTSCEVELDEQPTVFEAAQKAGEYNLPYQVWKDDRLVMDHRRVSQ